MKIVFHKLIGLAGVDKDENERAQYWDKVLQWPMLLLAIWMPFQFYIDYQSGMQTTEAVYFDWVVWWFFVVESALLLFLVDDKWLYFKTNWMNTFIIIAGLPIILWGYSPLAAILRSLRLLLMAGLIYRLTKAVRKVLNKNQLGKTLLISLLLVFVSGVIISTIDPAFKSPADGIWWALVTISTVGYGDFTPTSIPGRMFASVLIVAGVVLFSLVTANLAAYFVEKEVEEESEQDELNFNNAIDRLETQLKRIEEKIEKLSDDKS